MRKSSQAPKGGDVITEGRFFCSRVKAHAIRREPSTLLLIVSSNLQIFGNKNQSGRFTICLLCYTLCYHMQFVYSYTLIYIDVANIRNVFEI